VGNHREPEIVKKLGLKSATENKPPVVNPISCWSSIQSHIIQFILKLAINFTTMKIIYIIIQKVCRIDIYITILDFVYKCVLA
jgi:hypothetical protein